MRSVWETGGIGCGYENQGDPTEVWTPRSAGRGLRAWTGRGRRERGAILAFTAAALAVRSPHTSAFLPSCTVFRTKPLGSYSFVCSSRDPERSFRGLCGVREGIHGQSHVGPTHPTPQSSSARIRSLWWCTIGSYPSEFIFHKV